MVRCTGRMAAAGKFDRRCEASGQCRGPTLPTEVRGTADTIGALRGERSLIVRGDRLEAAKRQLHALSRVWRVNAVARLNVACNPRLRTTRARYLRQLGRIELNPRLLPEEAAIAVVHEAAHAATVQLYGRRVRPHGPEWRALVSKGLASSRAGRHHVTAVGGTAPRRPPTQSKRGLRDARYDHWCPICQFSRVGRRRVAAWRCAACVSAGLDGRLRITRVMPTAPRGGR